MEATEAITQLLTCLEVLMQEVTFQSECEEWFGLSEAERHNTPSPVRPDGDELHTAMWQTVEITMTLLQDHLALVELFEAAAADAKRHEQVGEIIRPHLIVPDQ